MQLSTPVKILVALLTVLPSIYMALFFASFFVSVAAGPDRNPVFDHFELFMAIHLGVMVLMLALLAFYTVFLFKTDAVRNDMKALWAVVLFFGAPVSMPIFWYLYVWRQHHLPASPAVA
ncbi:MAG: hypothetical protein WA208_10410 [Thermoanaerobaculia bacterium]